jgi:DNA-binding NarL/FixJ family response regulator
MLSVHYSSAFVQAAFRYGALGYITKGAPASELHTAVRIVADGRVYAGSEAAAALTDTGPLATSDPAESLTPREREVAIFLTRGHTTAEAARELGVSPKTVEAHRASIFRKLEVRNAVQLTRLFVRNDTPEMN